MPPNQVEVINKCLFVLLKHFEGIDEIQETTLTRVDFALLALSCGAREGGTT